MSTANAERLHETAEGSLFTLVKAMVTVMLGKKTECPDLTPLKGITFGS